MSAPLAPISKPPVGTTNWHPSVWAVIDRVNDLAEIIRDTTGATLLAGSGILIAPNDAGDSITISASGGGGGLDAEGVMDLLGTTGLVAGNNNLIIAYDDVAGTITLTAQTSSETVRDSVGAAGVGGHGISFVADDALDTLTWSLDDAENPNWMPSDYGWEGWTIPPAVATSSSNLVNGVIHLAKIKFPKTETINTIPLQIATAGAGLSNCYVALFNAAGTRLGVSADQSAAWQSGGSKQVALTAGAAVTKGYGYVALLQGGSTTAAAVSRGSTSGAVNNGLSAPNLMVTSFGTGQTSIPSSIDFTGQLTTNLIQFLAGIKL